MANIMINNLQDKIDVTEELKALVIKAVNSTLSVEKPEKVEVSIALLMTNIFKSSTVSIAT